MKLLLLALSAFVAIASCSPLESMQSSEAGVLDMRAAPPQNCTTYCSVDAGCVCTIRPANCNALYTVQPGDTCTSIAQSYKNFTVTQLYLWNPNVTQTCQSLLAYVPVCIGVTSGYKFVPPVQPAYGTHYTPKQTPVPIMPNITKSCTSFELVASGTTPAQLAQENKFPVANFAKWNGGSKVAWADYWACVKV